MVEVSRDDAGIMRPVPGSGRRRAKEVSPAHDSRCARRSWPAGDEPVRFPRVAQQALVDRPPPLAAGPLGLWRCEHAPSELPPHEGQLGPPVRPDRHTTGLPVVKPAREPQTQGRIVPDRRHDGGGLFRRITGHCGALVADDPSATSTRRIRGGHQRQIFIPHERSLSPAQFRPVGWRACALAQTTGRGDGDYGGHVGSPRQCGPVTGAADRE